MSALSTTWRVIKSNPWKFFLGSFSAVFLTIVGIVYSDINFEHKSELVKYKDDTAAVIKDLQTRVDDLTKQVTGSK
jgi:hypothetical protein